MTAKILPNLPLDSIAHHRVANLTAHRDPEPALNSVIRLCDHDKVSRMKLAAGVRQLYELGSFTQAGRFRKPFAAALRHWPRSAASPFWWHRNRELFPPLGPAPPEHVAPAGGCHAGEKAMGPFSFDVTRLIGSFHRNSTPSGHLNGQVVISIIQATLSQF